MAPESTRDIENMQNIADIAVSKEYARFSAATDVSQVRGPLADQLSSLWKVPVEIDNIFATRVTAQSGGAFEIQYEVTLNRPDYPAPFRAYFYGLLTGDNRAPELPGISDSQLLFLENLGLYVPVFPHDSKLPQLAAFFDLNDPSRENDCVDIAGLDKGYTLKPIEVCGYRFGRRLTFRAILKKTENGVVTSVKEVIVKVCRRKMVRRLLVNLNHLSASGFGKDPEAGIKIPALLFAGSDSRVIMSQAVPGPSLHDLLNSDHLVAASCSRAGQALRKLHQLGPGSLPLRSAESELSNTMDKVVLTTELFPQWQSLFTDIKERLLDTLSLCDGVAPVLSHCDYYDKQVLYNDTQLTLLDWDTLSAADPALDYGNFQAHLCLRRLQIPERDSEIEAASAAFSTGYGVPDDAFADRVRWWQSLTLTRLACLYALRPRWRQLAPDLLEAALTMIAMIEKKHSSRREV